MSDESTWTQDQELAAFLRAKTSGYIAISFGPKSVRITVPSRPFKGVDLTNPADQETFARLMRGRKLVVASTVVAKGESLVGIELGDIG